MLRRGTRLQDLATITPDILFLRYERFVIKWYYVKIWSDQVTIYTKLCNLVQHCSALIPLE